jgi:hypothetical protein
MLERFCCIPKFLHIAWENCDANRGSWLEMMRRGSLKKGRTCFMYKHTDSVPSIVLRQGINYVAFEQPWSTIERIESKLSDRGRSVIKSMDMYWNGPCSTCVSNLCRGTFLCGRLVLDSWHLEHPLTYSSTNSWSRGPSYDCFMSSHVFEIPGWPPAGLSWISRNTARLFLMSSSRKSFWIVGSGVEKRVSSRRIRGLSVFTCYGS